MTVKFDSSKTIFLVDGSAFLYRAYYGTRPLHTSSGEPVQAVYSFCRMIKKLAQKFQPQYLALVWDSRGKTERHEIFADYKATRQAPPNDLFSQKELIWEIANLIGLHQCAQVGVEADDLIYSLATDFENQGYQVVIVSSDKDLFQLLSDQIFIYDAFKDQVVTRAEHEQKIGFPIERLPIYFALLGDTSDHIPGVKGIGAKGATELVQQFASLDDLYAQIDQVAKLKTKQALLADQANAYLSLNLFNLRYHRLGLVADDLKFSLQNWSNARDLFVRLEFKSFVQELGGQQLSISGLSSVSSVQAANESVSYFADQKGYKFLSITTESELIKLCDQLVQNLFALDTETTGLDPLQTDLVGLSFCYQKGLAYYLPLRHQNLSEQLSLEVVWRHLKPILESPKYPKCLHNAKFDQLVLWHAGIELQGVVFDTMLAANLLVKDDWQRVGLKRLSERYLNEQMLDFNQIVKDKNSNFSALSIDLAVKYAAADAHQTYQLYQLLWLQITEQQQAKLFYELELPISQLLFKMERVGIKLDQVKLWELNQIVTIKIQEIERQVFEIAQLDPSFNLNSPRQVEELLFQRLGLPTQKKSSKRTGYSTDQEVLDALSDLHPVPKLILKYRELMKLKTTYLEALPGYLNSADGCVHTSFSQIATATGRLASSDPNLQNIPVSGIGGQVRAAFLPQEGQVFLAADYSQIELRVLAYLSQDQVLVNSFQNNLDIHSLTASRLFDVDQSLVSHEQRQIGKRINFSILYGLTPYGLSKDLKISLGSAKKYIERFFEQYPGVQSWMDSVVAQAKECGYVTTVWGRRRYVPGIYEKNQNLYDAAKRIAINTVAQGTAAELVKKGMLDLEQRLAPFDAQILLQIHDELLVSVAQDQAGPAQEVLVQVLENVVSWNVPLQVTIRSGQNWQEVTK